MHMRTLGVSGYLHWQSRRSCKQSAKKANVMELSLKTKCKKNDIVCKLMKTEGFWNITSIIGIIRIMKSGLISTAAESIGHLQYYFVFKVTVVKCEVLLDPLAPENQIEEGMQTISKSSISHFSKLFMAWKST